MKKLFTKAAMLIGFLFVSSNVVAQQFKTGLILGISTSQVDGDTYAGYNKVGLFAGGIVSKRISKDNKWHFVFEITYIQKGSRKVPHPERGDNASYFLKLNYAEVPLLVNYNFLRKDTSGGITAKYSLEAGLAFARLVQSKETDASGIIPFATPFQKSDYSIILGINYFLTKRVIFNVRTEYSVAPVRKFGATHPWLWTYKFIKPGYYNNLINFSFRYKI